MAQYHWVRAVDGNFGDYNGWGGSPGQIPHAGDDAYLDASGAAFTVSSGGTYTVAKIGLTANASFVVYAGTFTTSAIVNAGTIVDEATLQAQGTISNTGAIEVERRLILEAGVSLTGVGTIDLGGQIYGLSASDTLTNVHETIIGAGQLGYGEMTLVNQAKGVIDATSTAIAMTIYTQTNAITNAGLIEATGSAGLVLRGTTIHNAGGRIFAGTGSAVSLQQSLDLDIGEVDIVGGTLATKGSGVIQTAGGVILDGTTAALTNAGTFEIVNGNSATLEGTIVNTGAIELAGTGGYTSIYVSSSGLTLEGGGVVVLGDANVNVFEGTTGTITNVDNTISGAGQIGRGDQAVIVNQAAGVIDATGVSNALDINPLHTLINAGLIETTGAAGMTIEATFSYATTVANSGMVRADGSGSLTLFDATVANDPTGVMLVAAGLASLSGGQITGGALTVAAGGQILVDGAGAERTRQINYIDVATFDNQGLITIQNGFGLTIQGSIDNHGMIALANVGSYAALMPGAGGLSLAGGGSVVMGDNNNNVLEGANGVLTNVDNTISGAGQIGAAGEFHMVNDVGGVIDATGTNNALVINPLASLVNAGLIETTGAAGLAIAATFDQTTTVANSGTVEAAGPGLLTLTAATVTNSLSGVVLVAANAHASFVGGQITGGTLTVDAGGQLTVDGAGSSRTSQINFIAVKTLDNRGVITVENNNALTLQGSIDNTGTISLASIGGTTQLIVGANGLKLGGRGKLILSDQTPNTIVGAASGDTLTNLNNTISGAGQFGNGELTLVNGAKGVIEATGTNNALVINTGAATIANAGRIEAAGAGGAAIDSAVNNTGTLEALGGVLTVNAAIVGTGSAFITKGTLYFTSSFNENVTFKGTGGVLELAQSQGFSSTISGFSTKGKTSLDLRDIGFVSAGEATFSGTATAGVLTVSDGSHTASITMVGDFLSSTWVASSDGHGGVRLVDPTAKAPAGDAGKPSVHAFIAAMAGPGNPGAPQYVHASQAWPWREPNLVNPRAVAA